MARLNFRLTCSLLAVGIVAFLALLPSTRTLVQRQIWILTGKYEQRIKPDPDMFFATNGMLNDERVLTILQGFNRVPAESRAVEMMRVAAAHKDAALWAHTIRQTTFAPLPTQESLKKYNVADRIRTETMGRIELVAAEEGAKLDPDNVYFALAKAGALVRLQQWDKLASALIEAGRRTKYDDYVFDEFRRRSEGLLVHGVPILDSELGEQWSSILLPHLANFKSLTGQLSSIPDPKARYVAALGLARAGKVMEGGEPSITKLVGSSIVIRSAYEVAGVQYKSGHKDLAPVLGAIVAKGQALGDAESAKGWQAFETWKLVLPPPLDATYLPEGPQAMVAVYGLYLLVVFAALAAAVWLGGQVEPTASNAAILGCILLGAETFACLSVERSGLLFAMLLAGDLLFVAFLLIRLPGKAKLGWTMALVALGIAFLADMGQLFLGLVLVWGIPFALSRFLRRAAPQWTGILLATVFLGLAFFFLFGSFHNPIDFQKNLDESVVAALALAAFFVPVLAATVMSLTKTTLPEALKQIAWPLPLAVLAAAGTFAWGTREMLQWEKAWQEIVRKELPEKYQTEIFTIKSAARD